MTNRRQAVIDAAKCLGATIESPLEKHIMDAAIDEIDPQSCRNPDQSEAMNNANCAVADAEQTLTSTIETRNEVLLTEKIGKAQP